MKHGLGMSMNIRDIDRIIGLSGVDENETEQARRWGKLFEIPMILLAIWIIIEWYAESVGIIPRSITILTDWGIWLFFIIETLTLVWMVEDKPRYLKTNWLNLFIIIMGLPVIWGMDTYAGALRTLRLLLMISLLLNMSRTIRSILSRNKLGMSLLISGFVILTFGIIISAVDPAIESPLDGIWWAWVTVTTVGYGDIVPVSHVGRILGALLILLGVGLIALLTANFSEFFISRSEEGVLQEEEQTLKKLKIIESRLSSLEHKLDKLLEQASKD